MNAVNSDLLSPQACAEIDRWIVKYPPERKQSAILPALLIAQEYHAGWLPEKVIEAVAAYLEIPKIAAFEVATFYSMYELAPVGKNKISVCTSISCMLNGSDEIVDHLQRRLGIGLGETTADGKYSLREAECLAACSAAPVCIVNHHYKENMTPEKCDEILQKLEESSNA